jgi:hypothetical protein
VRYDFGGWPTVAGLFIWLTILAHPVQAADISAEKFGSGRDDAFIAISGDIAAGDLAKFKNIALAHDEAVVWLSSGGGLAVEAIEIGKIIRIKGYDTYVSEEPCNSACALIWIAGRRRYLSEVGRVGFHASYLSEGGRQRESGVGNAIVGSYLASLNLTDAAVIFATSAPPDRLNWLSSANADDIGIAVQLLAKTSDEPEPKSAKNSSKDDSTIFSSAGEWTIGIDHTVSDGCFVLGYYDGGVALRIGIDPREPRDNYLFIAGEQWKSIKEEATYEMEFSFGNKEAWEGKFTGIDLGGLKGVMIRFSEEEVLEEFSSTKNVRFFYKEKEIENFALERSGQALRELRRCQRLQDAKSRDPFAADDAR